TKRRTRPMKLKREYLSSSPFKKTSHPEHAEPCRRNRRVERRGERKRQHAARLGRQDDTVVPEPCGGVVRIALRLVLGADRRLEGILLLGRPFLALGLDV